MKARHVVFASLLLAFTGVAQNIGNADGWYAWRVPTADDVTIGNGSCSLEGSRGLSINRDYRAPGGSMIVAVRMEHGEVAKLRLLDGTCSADRLGNGVQWRDDVDPAASIAFLESHRGHDFVTAIALHEHPKTIDTLERLTGRGEAERVREQGLFWLGQRGGDRGFRFLRDFVHSDESASLRKKAVFALSQSQSEGAIPELIALARRGESSQIRREAIFWLGQRAGDKASEELRRAVDEDPDDDVREHAVFAISQLPKERSIPMLIDLVRNHKSAGVRKKAMFWLAQTGDERALALIEEILMK